MAVALVDVRRLAAVDMYGLAGTRMRRRVILAEFILGAVGGIVIGLLTARNSGAGWRAIGAWFVGVGLNYVVLALHAAWLSRADALDGELAGVEVGSELRHYTYRQFWIVMPLLLVVLAISQLRRRSSPLRR